MSEPEDQSKTRPFIEPKPPRPACKPQRAAIALGSNIDSPPPLGDRVSHLDFARQQIGKLPSTTLLAASRDYESEPVTASPTQDGGGPYLNAAVTVETSLSPRQLLNHLLQIEKDRGRDRAKEQRWGPRTLDLDLILYADRVIDEPGLQIPHPRMHERLFVLEPLAEIAPDWNSPTHDSTVSQMCSALGGMASRS